MMKFSAAAFLAILGSACAFSPVAHHQRTARRASGMARFVVTDPVQGTVEAVTDTPKLSVAELTQQIEVDAIEVKTALLAASRNLREEPLQPGRYDSLEYSKALPFFQRPPQLDGSHAGDMGFDPCGLSEIWDMYYMQECELRHARLAMLAVVGWPLSELVGPSFMLQDGQAPSVLNGFNVISAFSLLTAFAAFGLFEFQTSLRRTTGTELGDKHAKDMSKVWEQGVAGDYNFDPLSFYGLMGDDAQGRKAMRQVEVVQGRFAMVGISTFAVLEALTGKPIVEDNMFFHPNAVLPLLAVSYFAWSQIYQLSDVRQYPIRIEYTKDGEEMLRGIKRSITRGSEE